MRNVAIYHCYVKSLHCQNTLVIETGLFDFHKMTVTVLKTCTKKEVPKIISYRDYKHFSNEEAPKIISYRHYKNFSNELFQAELNLLLSLEDMNNITCDKFDDIIMFLVNKHMHLNI